MLFDELTINIIKILINNYANFKLDDVNKKLKIVQYQLIIDIFASFNIFDNKFQNNNENQKKIAFIIHKNIFNDILNVKFNYRYRKR